MGLFNHNNSEKLYNVEDYIIGVDSHIIYHVPKFPENNIYVFPEGTTGLSESAIMEMRNYKAKTMVVPASFKKFNAQLIYFENLETIQLSEGIEEVKCTFGQRKTTVNIILPKTIKKIGQGNYPVVQDLVLPNGVVEIENLFASHDTNLISVNIPGTLKKISQGAFNQCRNLQSVILNEGVETSLQDILRGTNNLRLLDLPSTYNGTINLLMDARSLSNIRGNSSYNGKSFEKEKNQILHIKVKRENKIFEFNIKRGEQPVIDIKQNIIKIRGANQPQVISINCTQLKPGAYDIENGTVRQSQFSPKRPINKETNPTQDRKNIIQNAQEQEVMSKLDVIFQDAYRNNITKMDDFIDLPDTTKMQIKKAMKESFFQMTKQFGTINTDSEMFKYLYYRALREIGLDENSQSFQTATDFGSNRMKR